MRPKPPETVRCDDRISDLVVKLTAIADRYCAAGGAATPEAGARIAALRAAAASGRRALAPR